MKTVAIVGPTASGKTELSLNIAGDKFEIVSADSVQVYLYMNIGSSKPGPAELNAVRHHLIDVVNPDYHFTAGDYCIKANEAIGDIAERGKLPLVVGGTGFYVNSLFFGIDEIPDIDETVRTGVADQYDNGGSEALYNELLNADPAFAGKVHINDRQRIIRGVSVLRGTGRSISSFFGKKRDNKNFDVFFIGLYIEKNELNRRIDKRVDSMIDNGLVEEVEMLRSMGYAPSLNSMQSIGYSEINSYIDGSVSLEAAIYEIKRNTKKYAKKQVTWFKRNRCVNWFNPDEIEKIPEILKRWLN